MNCKKTRLFSLKHKSKIPAPNPENLPAQGQNPLLKLNPEQKKEVSHEAIPPTVENFNKNDIESKIRKNNLNVINFYMDTLTAKPLKGPKYLIANGFVEIIIQILLT